MKWLTLILALAACAAPQVSLDPPAQPPPAKDYIDLLKKWTRHGQLQSDFEEALSVDATMMSPEFRAAFAERYISVYKLSPEEAGRKRAEILSDAADQFSFHVETSTHAWQLNDLSGTKSVWRISLVDDKGREITTKDIHLKRTAREFDAAFFPYQNVFSRSWRILIPRTFADGTLLYGPNTRSLTLRFAGPQGSVDLVWQLH